MISFTKNHSPSRMTESDCFNRGERRPRARSPLSSAVCCCSLEKRSHAVSGLKLRRRRRQHYVIVRERERERQQRQQREREVRGRQSPGTKQSQGRFSSAQVEDLVRVGLGGARLRVSDAVYDLCLCPNPTSSVQVQ